jgi:hypothetical protein
MTKPSHATRPLRLYVRHFLNLQINVFGHTGLQRARSGVFLSRSSRRNLTGDPEYPIGFLVFTAILDVAGFVDMAGCVQKP